MTAEAMHPRLQVQLMNLVCKLHSNVIEILVVNIIGDLM